MICLHHVFKNFFVYLLFDLIFWIISITLLILYVIEIIQKVLKMPISLNPIKILTYFAFSISFVPNPRYWLKKGKYKSRFNFGHNFLRTRLVDYIDSIFDYLYFISSDPKRTKNSVGLSEYGNQNVKPKLCKVFFLKISSNCVLFVVIPPTTNKNNNNFMYIWEMWK